LITPILGAALAACVASGVDVPRGAPGTPYRGAGGDPPPGSSGDSEGADGGTTSGGSSSGSSSGGPADSGPPKDSSASDDGAPDASIDTGPSDPFAAARALCARTINNYRAGVGLAPLAPWNADTCSDSQARSDGLSRTAHGAFGMCDETAQNECPGWPGTITQALTSCLAAMWEEGPGGGHYDNMTTTWRTDVACGFYQTAGGRWWIVQDFR
jgi:hypothetical protein